MKTIEQLRQELAVREAELTPLQSQRDNLAKRLAAVEKQIATLTGEMAPARGRAKQIKRGGRRSGRKPLAEYVQEVLAKQKDGLGIKQIAEAVQAAGYQTMSKNFNAVVTLLLGKDKRFGKVSRGVYKLA